MDGGEDGEEDGDRGSSGGDDKAEGFFFLPPSLPDFFQMQPDRQAPPLTDLSAHH